MTDHSIPPAVCPELTLRDQNEAFLKFDFVAGAAILQFPDTRGIELNKKKFNVFLAPQK